MVHSQISKWNHIAMKKSFHCNIKFLDSIEIIRINKSIMKLYSVHINILSSLLKQSMPKILIV